MQIKIQDVLKELNLKYDKLHNNEQILLLDDIYNEIDKGFAVTGETMRPKWAKHWEEVSRQISGDSQEDFRPRYDNHLIFRLNGQYVGSNDPLFEFKINSHIRKKLFECVPAQDTVFDFGCGSCLNAKLLPNHYVGMDWADACGNILQQINPSHQFIRYDMLHPHKLNELNIHDKTVITTHALEQLGTDFVPLMEVILNSRPRLVIHLEPIYENYTDSPLDLVAKKYHESRNYLRGLLPYLQNNAQVEIIESYKIQFGTRYHDGYSVVKWRRAG